MAMLHGCLIGDGCLIGIGAMILNGAKIGANCLIGAHTFISEGKIIPDNSMVLGTPGKVVKTLTPEQVSAFQKGVSAYVTHSDRFKRHCIRIDEDMPSNALPGATTVEAPTAPKEERAVNGSTTFRSLGEMMEGVVWARVGDASKRDWQGDFAFFRPDAPTATVTTEWGVFEDVVEPFGNFQPHAGSPTGAPPSSTLARTCPRARTATSSTRTDSVLWSVHRMHSKSMRSRISGVSTRSLRRKCSKLCGSRRA